MKWIEESKCLKCGSTEIIYRGFGMVPVLRFENVFANAPLALVTTYSICVKCGLIFQNPHLDNEGLEEFYKSGLYRQLVYDPENQMDIDEQRGQIAWADLVPPAVTHLDIGCSHGTMLELTRLKNCKIMGVEPNRNYVNFGVPSVATIYEVEGEWDVITCKHVLEHVPDLLKFVEKMTSLLAPGGTLFLEVPDEAGEGGSARLPHLYMFTEEVVRDLFAGLTVEGYQRKPHHFFKMRKPT